MFNESVVQHKNSTSAQHKNSTKKCLISMKKQDSFRNVIVCREKLSPFWIAQWTDGRGRRVRRSTKVPVGGGEYRGERLSEKQAERRAVMVAWELARVEEEDFKAHDNTTMRELCRLMLGGKLGRVSLATYGNARTDYKQFLGWLGRRADEPCRLISRADMRAWLAARRAEVRHNTVKKAIGALRAAFAYAVDADIIDRNPCDGLKNPPDTKVEKVVHEAFTEAEVRLLVEKLPEVLYWDVWAAAGGYSQFTLGCV